MLLKKIYESSNYLTDEEATTNQVVNSANGAIAEINTKVGTKLPFYASANYQEESYDKFGDSWQLRLIEPYLSFSIAANDTDIDARDFHYNRFLAALKEFQISGIDSIKTDDVDEEGNPIDYKGTASRIVKINASARPNPFSGWWV